MKAQKFQRLGFSKLSHITIVSEYIHSRHLGSRTEMGSEIPEEGTFSQDFQNFLALVSRDYWKYHKNYNK